MSDYVSIERYRELEKENNDLRKTIEKLKDQGDKWFAENNDLRRTIEKLIPIEKYRELEKENIDLRKTIDELKDQGNQSSAEINDLQKTIEKFKEKRDQWFAEMLNFWMKFLQNAGSCDPDLREETTENAKSRHITPKLKVKQTPISINSEITRLFLKAVQNISGKKCDRRLTEMYEIGFWTYPRQEKKQYDHSIQVGPHIFEFRSVTKGHIKLMILKYDDKYLPKYKEGKLEGKRGHWEGKSSFEEAEHSQQISDLHIQASNLIERANVLELENCEIFHDFQDYEILEANFDSNTTTT